MGSTIGVFIADPHFAGNSIGARRDDYTKSISEKMIEALSFARDLPANYVCILGDIFNHCDPGGSVRNAAVEVLACGNDGGRWPFDILCVVGNHDMGGHTIATLNRTAIETLSKSGVIDIFDEKPSYDLFAIHYENDVEEKEFKSDMAIWAAHANILPKRFIGPHVTIDDFKVGPRTKVVVSGHWHNGYPITKRDDGVIFVNPGSLGRPRMDDAGHDIKIAVIEYDDNTANARFVEIKCAKHSSDIFPTVIVEKPEKDRASGSFIDKLNELRGGLLTGTDSLQLIEEAAKNNNPGDDVVKECRDRIEKQRKETAK